MIKTIKTPSLVKFVLQAIRKEELELHVSVPGKIKDYDETTQRATVVPLLKKKWNDSSSTLSDLPILNNVPVHCLSANNRKTFIHLPIKKGDLGMIMFCDRSIDNYLSSSPQEGEEVKPVYHNSPRHHDLSDAWFIPGVLPFKLALQNVSKDDIVIKNDKFIINIKPDGTITIDNGTNELIETLSTLIQNLIDAKVLTLMGPQPFWALTVSALQIDKNKIDSFKE
jgi:hypothetical protein